MKFLTTKRRVSIVATIALLSIALTACGPFKAPTDAAKGFMAQLRTDTNAAYESTTPSFKELTTIEQFNGFLEVFPEMTQVADSRFNSWNIVNNEADISGTVFFDDDSDSTISFVLLKEAGVWKVAGFALNPEELEDADEPITE